MKFSSTLLLLATVVLSSCIKNNNISPAPTEVMGYAPVYGSETTDDSIKTLAPRATEKGGKIYLKGNYFFQVENKKGIHIIDVSNPAAPKKVSFITVSGCSELAVYNNFLYTNQKNDLLILDISDVTNIKLQGRLSKAFSIFNPQLPPLPGYFECPNTRHGTVVDWEYKLLKNPKCNY